MSSEVQGIVIQQIATPKGTWLQLKSRVWIYVPEKIKDSLIGYKVKAEGNVRNAKGCKSFFMTTRYEVLPFDKDEAMTKLMKYMEKIGFKEKSFFQLQSILMFFLCLFLIGKKFLIKKLSGWKKDKILKYLQNPYEFYFKKHLDYPTADMIATYVLTVNERQKIYPLAHFILDNAYKNGKEFMSFEELYSAVNKRVVVTKEEFRKILIENPQKAIVMDENDNVYLALVYYMKKKCFKILSSRNLPTLTVLDGLPSELQSILCWRYSVLTGTAGTGKTTLIRQLKDSGLKVIFTATTGKAAKRLGETATTIHYLLGFGAKGFSKDTVEADVVVIDEASQLDCRTLYHALTKINGHIIFVGDPEQTQPVRGSGVFQELILAMPEGAVKKLTEVYRTREVEFLPIKAKNKEDAWGKVVTLAVICEKKGYDWQIITPLRRTAHQLNLRVQSILRGNGSSEMFKKNDKVMFLKNLRVDGELIASNGQVGRVVKRDGEYYVVDFGNKLINCLSNELSLAYAITIHKDTGSEHDYVVCYIPSGVNEEFLNDNLLKVAATRAKVKTYLIYENESIKERVEKYVCRSKE